MPRVIDLVETGKILLRGQVALEYAAIVALSLAILVPLWLFVNSSIDSTKADLQTSYAKNALGKIRDAADAAFVEGPPARFSLYLTFPEGIQSTSVSGREVSMTLSIFGAQGAQSDAYITTIGNVTGSIPAQSGLIRLFVKAEYNSSSGENFVNITETA